MSEALYRVLTERMVADRMRPGDYSDLCRMHRDPRVMATLGGLRPPEDTLMGIDREIDHWQHYGFGLWTFRDPSCDAFIGRGGLRHTRIEGEDEVEVAYAVMPNYWGHGYATEMARLSVRTAFTELGLDSIVCFTMTRNDKSKRVMEKAGFIYERDIVHAELPHVLYRLRPDQV